MRVFLIAGEPSGDRLGAALMRGLGQLAPEVSFEGVGGPLMQAEGMNSLFPMEELSLMGIAEVLPRYPHLVRRKNQVADAVLAARPDALITIDSPDFCLRVARRVRARAPVRTVHYVAPSVWAWRPGRARKMARFIDQVLCLLPFEPPYMEAEGIAADFVGHPVVSEPVATPAEAAGFRDRHGLTGAEVLLVLPGSRRGEVALLADRFAETLRQVVARRPGLRVVLPAAPSVAPMLHETLRGWPGAPVLLDPTGRDAQAFLAEKRAAFAAADGALAASGTVSLELAAASTPMVVGYDLSWLSRQIIPRMIRVDTLTLVNLVSETRVVPEFIGAACRPAPMAQAVCAMLDAPEAQLEAMRVTMDRLGKTGEAPGMRAARAVLARL
ncbi:lipid-A-disaccharide synthase [Roseovarius salinarum]|uniref:lipid-A-disaccharide synthase n=1 Tax=Roseovarius salinarum TaxID=1981892 RepID=UPI000C32913B|nr:lipid-A-disaccharide synthase [Roseovarius salinarum]